MSFFKIEPDLWGEGDVLVGRRGRDGVWDGEREKLMGNIKGGGDEEEGYRLAFCKIGGRRGGSINHEFTII